MTAAPVLRLEELTASISAGSEMRHLVQGVTLDIEPGEKVGFVGESGSGKSITMLSIMGLLPPNVTVTSGSAVFAGVQLAGLAERDYQRIRGSRLAMVYQDPMSALNPVMRVGAQIAEGLRAHGAEGPGVDDTVRRVLGDVGIPDPQRIAKSFPHQLSGGMRQRVMIAMALAMEPELIIFDEPTTALDVTIQAQILTLVRELHAAKNTAIVWVTHDLALVSNLVDRIVVMYGGRIVEQGPVVDVLTSPRHRYTAALLKAFPERHAQVRERLAQIPGGPPRLDDIQTGCPFRKRCVDAIESCDVMPAVEADTPRHSYSCWVPIKVVS